MVTGNLTGRHAHYRFGYEEGRFSIFADTEKLKGTPLVSVRDPVREAERLVGNFRLRPGMLAVVAGVAHLPVLELLVEQSQDSAGGGGVILAFEADTELYLALKKLRPDIFSKVAVIVPDNSGILAELAEQIDIESFAGYRIFENRPSVALNPSFYSQVIHDFKKKLASRFSDLFTRLEFEERWVFNSLSKLPVLSSMRPVSALFGLGRGMQALIVSTGPSLRESLAEIAENRDRYFIACADSAYRVLVRYGITPHLILSLDSQAHTAKHFALLPRGKKGKFPILVCDAVANPVVARDWQGELCLSFTAQYPDNRRVVSPGCDFLEEEHFFKGTPGIVPGDLQSGGSVATSLFDLMRLMEFDTIILVGQDLAYTHREIHTPGTHHTDEWLSKTTNRLQPLENINERVLRRRHTKRENSLTGKPIVTDYILSLYRDWFAHAVAAAPVKTYNATKDGLSIPGAAPLASLAEATAPAMNESILARLLQAPTIEIIPERIAALREKIRHADWQNPTATLSFLRYAGRKFAIKARRAPEQAKRLQAKQLLKQRNFLRKLSSKLQWASARSGSEH